MRRTIEVGKITAGALAKDGRVRLRTSDSSGEVDILLPVQDLENTAMMLIRLASDAAQKDGDDTVSGFVTDSLDMSDPDEEDASTVLRLWSLGVPIGFLIDETLMVELQSLATLQLEAIRKSRG